VCGFFAERGCTLLSDHYAGNKQKLSYLCKCGNKSIIKLNHLLNGRLCKRCGHKKVSKANKSDYDYVKGKFEEKGFTLLSNSYSNSREKLRYICKCGRESETSYGNLYAINGCKQCWYHILRTDHYLKNHDMTPEERTLKRKLPEYQEWRTSIFARDDYTCLTCNQRGYSLNAHHLDGYHWCVNKRFDSSNGITLCGDCHRKFHSKYSNRNNTSAQFIEWLNEINPEKVGIFNARISTQKEATHELA
jgi:hypothetical protein